MAVPIFIEVNIGTVAQPEICMLNVQRFLSVSSDAAGRTLIDTDSDGGLSIAETYESFRARLRAVRFYDTSAVQFADRLLATTATGGDLTDDT